MDNFLLVFVDKAPCLWLWLEGYCPKHSSNFISWRQNIHSPSWIQVFTFLEAVARRAHYRPFNIFPVFRATFLRLSPTLRWECSCQNTESSMYNHTSYLSFLWQCMCIASLLLPAGLIRCVARVDQLVGMISLITPLGRLNYFPSCIQWAGHVSDTLYLQGDDKAKHLVLGVMDGWIMQKFGDRVRNIFKRGTDCRLKAYERFESFFSCVALDTNTRVKQKSGSSTVLWFPRASSHRPKGFWSWGGKGDSWGAGGVTHTHSPCGFTSSF